VIDDRKRAVKEGHQVGIPGLCENGGPIQTIFCLMENLNDVINQDEPVEGMIDAQGMFAKMEKQVFGTQHACGHIVEADGDGPLPEVFHGLEGAEHIGWNGGVHEAPVDVQGG